MSYCEGDAVWLRTGDEWNGLPGVIDRINGRTIYVFCVQFPWTFYYVDIADADKILEKFG